MDDRELINCLLLAEKLFDSLEFKPYGMARLGVREAIERLKAKSPVEGSIEIRMAVAVGTGLNNLVVNALNKGDDWQRELRCAIVSIKGPPTHLALATLIIPPLSIPKVEGKVERLDGEPNSRARSSE